MTVLNTPIVPNNPNDLILLNLIDQVSADYQAFLKSVILPDIDADDPIKIREVRVLLTMSSLTDPITSRDIAEELRYDPATVSRAVKRLHKSGLIQTEPDRMDSRQVRLTLTSEGQSLCDNVQMLISQAMMRTELQTDLELTHSKRETLFTQLSDLRDWAQALGNS